MLGSVGGGDIGESGFSVDLARAFARSPKLRRPRVMTSLASFLCSDVVTSLVGAAALFGFRAAAVGFVFAGGGAPPLRKSERRVNVVAEHVF